MRLFPRTIKAFKAFLRPKNTTYKYRYQIHPFDNARYFTITAENEEKADELATDKYTAMFNAGQTVMKTFDRVA